MDQTDHDILISMKSEFGTKLDRVIADVKELKDNVADRVTALELEKANKHEVTEALALVTKSDEDKETRLRALEQTKADWSGRYAILAVIIMFVIGLLGTWLSKLLFGAK